MLKLNRISIQNWKCFTNKIVEFNDNINLLKWQNGTGKSSLIEAIIFAFFDKRPNGLDYDSLRNDNTINCKIVLEFTYNMSTYIIEREFGKSSSYRTYKDNELVARSKAEHKAVIEKILPEVIINGLWGYQSLALSPVLKTDYLYELLETTFEEPLALKKYFLTERTFNQKHIAALEKTIQHQDVSEERLNKLRFEIENIEVIIKEKVFISDNAVIKAKQCEQDYPKYISLKEQLSNMTYEYDRDVCLRLHNTYKLKTATEWHLYFKDILNQLNIEKAKTQQVHPLLKYPKNIIDSLNKDSVNNNNTCVLCGSTQFKPIILNYDKIDSAKIERLEKIYKDYETYDFNKLAQSIRYFQIKKQCDDLSYIDIIDWKNILSQYNAETNALYNKLDYLKAQYDAMKQDLGKLSDLLQYKTAYNNAKECIGIIEEYIDAEKNRSSSSIKKAASVYLNKFNPRYSKLDVENGVYKVTVNNDSYTKQSSLAVASLSNGEKTLVALSLILAIRDIFFKGLPLIMDEAFANLDANNVTAINSLLRHDISQWIVVSHDERMQLEEF